MPAGRPVKPLSKKEVQMIVKKEVEKSLSQLSVKTILIGTKRKGRPIGSGMKRKKK